MSTHTLPAHVVPQVGRVELLLAVPSPCDRCAAWSRCAAERLACEAFAMFVQGAGQPRWRNAPKSASAQVFRALFGAPVTGRPRKVTDRRPAQRDAVAARMKAFRRLRAAR